MSIRTLRDAIVTELDATISEFANVAAHDGAFTLEEVKRHFGHHPRAARVVCHGVRSVEDHGGAPIGTASFTVFIAARHQNAADPDGAMTHGDACMVLAQRVLALVNTNPWSDSAYGAPSGISASNLYGGELDKIGISIWTVEWDQSVEMPDQLTAAADLDSLTTVHTEHGLTMLSDEDGDPIVVDGEPVVYGPSFELTSTLEGA